MDVFEGAKRSRQAVLNDPAPVRSGVDSRWVSRAIMATQRFLLSSQKGDGHWCAELEGDTVLASEYILTLQYLGLSDGLKARKAAEHLRRTQDPAGGWEIYLGSGADVNPTAKAYFALKLLGDDPDAPHMARARQTVLDLGGLHACNSFTKIFLAVFGQYEWSDCPAVPPELVLFPSWFPFNIYEMSSWTRAIVVPLSLVWAHRPRCPVPEGSDIGELIGAERRTAPRPRPGEKGSRWATFFMGVDRAFKLMERSQVRPFRKIAIRRCEAWIRDRLEKSDGLGAIFPPIINTIIAFRCLGHSVEDPVLASQIRELEKLEIEDEETLRVQPCFSPVWDTALAANALVESGLEPSHPALTRTARWLLEREVQTPGDWAMRSPELELELGGWYFEYANEFCPDCDDTAQVLTTLAKLRLPDEELDERSKGAMERALHWLLAMQNSNGGWASFDRDCDREYLTFIPFADHNAMIDPATSDITARVLETLAILGFESTSHPVERALEFMRSQQESDGSWYGRWGCNYLYGTWLALTGLEAIGVDPSEEWVQRAADWVRGCQNPDGGWGELPASYADPGLKGQGPSTASQTAWAVLALLASGDSSRAAVTGGVDYLLRTQRPDGSWEDEYWTGTGFPEVFYLRYHMYATYFPLQALGRFGREAFAQGGGSPKLLA